MNRPCLSYADTTRDIVDDALAAFWDAVLRRCPEARTGYMSMDREIALRVVAEAAIQEWLANNNVEVARRVATQQNSRG